MNSVHEQCPNSDSETVLSPKTGWVHQVHSLLAQPAHPTVHRRDQARARMAVSQAVAAVSWPWPSTVCKVLCRVVGALASCHRHYAARLAVVSWACLAIQLPASCSPGHNTLCILQYKSPVARPSCHDTIPSIAIQYPLFQPLLVTIQSVYCDTTSPATQASVTIQWCIAIHPQAIQALHLQYNSLPTRLGHNTILLGSSPTNFLHHFFFRFSSSFFFHFFY